MGNAIRRLGPGQAAVTQHRRKISRAPAHAVAQLRSLDGESVRVIIGDVSAHGCSLRCSVGWLRTGRFVAVSLDDTHALRAIVRWVRDDTAGLEFLRPIPLEYGDWHALIGRI